MVSIDAIGTQVNIAQNILDKKAHYFLAVKENQGTLNEAMVDDSVITNLLAAPHRRKPTMAV